MFRTTLILMSLLLAIVLAGCKSFREKNQLIEFDSIDLSSQVIPVNPLDTTGDGLPIFYNMYRFFLNFLLKLSAKLPKQVAEKSIQKTASF